ncbi:MAG: hypothetical protein GTO55_06090 [Armatimonadetes bacterium]|nr:hypothetical protein [Armatimonadota bacterium]NIM23823.1 hypothetical protein [Armatimonadota bacterium]NIM67702.1 hypothetical protein [Armatimonadota bacterium]NIM76211.1 hypothetical protein [Armatimonadota bacterium]NIN05904.1 hypothetical protein [Armatimonadota bacterium]
MSLLRTTFRLLFPIATLALIACSCAPLQAAAQVTDVPALIGQLSDADPLVRWRAAAALQWYDEPAAVEAMLRALQDSDSRVKKTAARALGWYEDARAIEQLALLLDNEDRSVAGAAADALGHFKDPAVTEILIASAKKRFSDQVNWAIEAQGAAAIDLLAQVMREPESRRREWAVQRLGYMQEKDPRIVPLLLQGLSDPDAGVRSRAGSALARQDDPRTVEALINAFEDAKDRQERSRCLSTLSRKRDPHVLRIMLDEVRRGNDQIPSWYLRECGPEEVDALIAALRDESSAVRDAAAVGLAHIGDPRVIPALVEALTRIDSSAVFPGLSQPRGVYGVLIGFGPQVCDAVLAQVGKAPDSYTRSALLRILAVFEDPRAFQPLMNDLSRSNEDSRDEACTSLGLLGDQRALPALRALLTDNPSWEEQPVMRALGDLRDTRSVPALIAALQDYESSTRWVACEALGKIGDARAIEPLQQALNEKDEEVRIVAAKALANMEDPRVIPVLVEMMKNNDPGIRGIGISGLKQNGSDAAVEALLEPLLRGTESERLSTINALYGNSADNPRIIEALKAALQDPSRRVRFYALSRLRVAAPQAKDIAVLLPPLIADTVSDDEMVRLIIAAFEQWQDPRTAKPLLFLLADSDVRVQWVAAAGLGAIGEKRAVPQLIRLAEPAPSKSGPEYRGHRSEMYMRAAALQALGDIGDARAMPVLLACLREDPPGDCEPTLGKCAALALGKLHDRRAVRPLILSLRDRLVRDEAAEALREITHQDFGIDAAKWEAWWREQR